MEYPGPALSCWNNTIVVGSLGGDIIILNAITGSQIAVLSGHTGSVNSVTYSSDGVSLVSGSNDRTVRLWDVQTGGVDKTFHGHTQGVCSVSISADYTRIASGSWDHTICLWDIQRGECYCILKQEDKTEYVSFCPTDPQYLLSICNNKVWQWDINGHQAGPTYNGSCVSFSPDGTQFVSYYKEAITVRNSSSGVIETEFQAVNSNIEYCCFSPDGRVIAAASHDTVYIWDITSLEPHSFKAITHISRINSLAFSSPSSLVSASYDESIKFWQIGASSGPIMTHSKSTFPTSHELRSITLQAKDSIIITGDSNGVVKTWDILTGCCKASFQTLVAPNQDTLYVLSGGRFLFSQDVQLIDGRLIIVWYENQKINTWDVGRGELLFVVDGPNELEELKISEDGFRIFCLGEGFIQALSVQTGEICCKVNANDPFHRFLTIDGSRVWVGNQGWDFGTPGSLPIQLPNIPPHRLHPNGVMLWDISLCRVKDKVTGKVLFQLPERYGKPVDVQWDGQYLLALFLPIEVLIFDFRHILL